MRLETTWLSHQETRSAWCKAAVCQSRPRPPAIAAICNPPVSRSSPGKQRRQGRNFIHHLRRVLIIPPRSQGAGDVLNDLPIRPATLEWIENLVEPLDAPLRAGESPFLFEAGRSGQHNIGVSTCVAEENVLYNEKIKFFKCSAYIF